MRKNKPFLKTLLSTIGELRLCILSLGLLLLSCTNNRKFDRTGWMKKEDLNSYPNRAKMLDDLTKNHKLIGLTYTKLIELLGMPEPYADQEANTITYTIITDYGHDIDPVYSKDLEFEMTKDSIVKNYKIVETKN